MAKRQKAKKPEGTKLGHRSFEELQSMINNGVFEYDDCTIEKTSETHYRLTWLGFGSPVPQLLSEASSLKDIIEATKKLHIPIEWYCWNQYSNEDDEDI